ncbi:MAG: hypothetical protein CMP14_05925 [Rickettsiales bacterium]|nr:hypothetical protein [Rickettsiales bacterium]
MGKVAKEQGVTDPKLHPSLHKMCKKSSHTGNKPLVESLTNKGVMVTQKVRKAQENNRNR